jgi:hypothetical protein
MLLFSPEALHEWCADGCSVRAEGEERGGMHGGERRETAEGEKGGGEGVRVQGAWQWMHKWVNSAMRMCLEPHAGTQFTCFTSTKVQILTSACKKQRGGGRREGRGGARRRRGWWYAPFVVHLYLLQVGGVRQSSGVANGGGGQGGGGGGVRRERREEEGWGGCHALGGGGGGGMAGS